MLPPNLRDQYRNRLAELIRRGEEITVREKIVTTNNWVMQTSKSRQVKTVDWPEFVEWRTNCVTILDQLVPGNSLHRKSVEGFSTLSNQPDKLRYGIAFLKSLTEDFDNGLLENLAIQIEAEVSADYLNQAELLLGNSHEGKLGHVPAAVLAGAVLEKNLRTLCLKLNPPEKTTKDNGAPLGMNALVDKLKKRSVFNELMAKQLRAWAGIRNHAAHGEFDEFTPEQVRAMVSGIGVFLAQHA